MEVLNLEMFYREHTYSAPVFQFHKEKASIVSVKGECYLSLICMK